MQYTQINPFTAAKKFAETAALCGLFVMGASAQLSPFTPAPTAASILLPPPPAVVSTVPSNGDVNPYGVAFAPHHMISNGVLKPGDILVSNFNNSSNLQGTGTTVLRVDSHGQTSTFYQGKPGLGLTAALGITRTGIVFVGNMPTADGTSATVQQGSLLILDRNGNLLATLSDKSVINGPWGMAIYDRGGAAQVFVSNVLSGTVTRLDMEFSADGNTLVIIAATTIASGYNHRLDPAALVLGPSGLAYDEAQDILYVASSADNAVYAIPSAGSRTDASAGTGITIYQDNVHLHGPLDLVLTPSGHLVVANSDGSNVDPNQPSELVEFTVDGAFVAQFPVDANNGGAFGLALANLANVATRFAAVDDNASTLTIWLEPIQ